MEKGLYINNLRQVGRYFMQNITSVKDENVPLSKVFQMPSSSFYISSWLQNMQAARTAEITIKFSIVCVNKVKGHGQIS
jgi:hypothetical protein